MPYEQFLFVDLIYLSLLEMKLCRIYKDSWYLVRISNYTKMELLLSKITAPLLLSARILYYLSEFIKGELC